MPLSESRKRQDAFFSGRIPEELDDYYENGGVSPGGPPDLLEAYLDAYLDEHPDEKQRIDNILKSKRFKQTHIYDMFSKAESTVSPRPPNSNSKAVYPAKKPLIALVEQGKCKANCTMNCCSRGMQPIDQFLPAVSNITHKKRAQMLKLVEELHSLQVTDVNSPGPYILELMQRLANLRRKQCKTCRESKKKTRENPDTKEGACRAKWYEIKRDLESKGCSVCGCNDGMTVEHTIPSEKKRDNKGNTVSLSNISKWVSLGGPQAMQEEYDKESVVPMCINCNMMQPTCFHMQPKVNPDDLPDGKSGTNATPEEVAAYKKKWNLIEKRKMQAYVDNIKLNYVNASGNVGECEECIMKVIPHGSEWRPAQNGYPHVFQFAHRSELDKKDSVGELVNSGNSFQTARPLIDKEIRRSRMLCMCCADAENQARRSCPGPSEEGN